MSHFDWFHSSSVCWQADTFDWSDFCISVIKNRFKSIFSRVSHSIFAHFEFFLNLSHIKNTFWNVHQVDEKPTGWNFQLESHILFRHITCSSQRTILHNFFICFVWNLIFSRFLLPFARNWSQNSPIVRSKCVKLPDNWPLKNWDFNSKNISKSLHFT